MTKIHASMEYLKDGKPVHKDICPEGCKQSNLEEHAGELHRQLDKWLDKGGSGFFIIQQEGYPRKVKKDAKKSN